MKAYIGCGLTHVPRDIFGDHTDFIHGLAHALEHCTPPHTVRYALRDSDPQLASKPFEERAHLCYLWDRSMVKDADVLIAEPSFPSIGLGIEMQVAQTKDILVILCFRDFGTNRAAAVRYETPDHLKHDLQIGDGFVSLMALGMPSIFRLVKHEGGPSAFDRVIDAIKLLEKVT